MGRKKEIPDEVLLATARDILIEHGHTVATGVIARACGVSQATLFNRFGTKRMLMILALLPRFDGDTDLIPEAPDQRSIPLQLVEIGMALYQRMRANEPALRVLRAANVTFEEIQEASDEFAPLKTIHDIIRWFEDAQTQQRINPSLPAHTFAMIFGGSIRNLALEPFFKEARRNSQSTTHYITQLVDLLWRGLSND